jgi:hypothetical protein
MSDRELSELRTDPWSATEFTDHGGLSWWGDVPGFLDRFGDRAKDAKVISIGESKGLVIIRGLPDR